MMRDWPSFVQSHMHFSHKIYGTTQACGRNEVGVDNL